MRYGYRRVHVVLQREGWMTNIKRTRRIYGEMGLQLRAKPPKRRVKAKPREDRCPPHPLPHVRGGEEYEGGTHEQMTHPLEIPLEFLRPQCHSPPHNKTCQGESTA
jgi:hypothetical protein